MSKVLKVGDKAPSDGLYRVIHYQHRLPHTVSIRKDVHLPACRKCGDHVTFELVGTEGNGNELRSDSDFSQGAHKT